MKTAWITREHHIRQESPVSAELIRELNKILGIETRLSTVFHPQIDGQTE